MPHYTKKLNKVIKALKKASKTHAKQASILSGIEKDQRKRYSYLMSNKNEIDNVLSKGASKALDTASSVLKRVKTKLGI